MRSVPTGKSGSQAGLRGDRRGLVHSKDIVFLTSVTGDGQSSDRTDAMTTTTAD